MKLERNAQIDFLTLIKVCIKTSKIFLLTVLMGVLGALLCLMPAGTYLEEEFGLAWLFSLRGAITPPDDVVIVSIDQTSAEILHLPDDPEKWPRSYYARLIAKLNQQNPAIIALNIVFNENRDALSDQMLAEAMAKNKNVILSNYLKHKTIPLSDAVNAVSYESIIESIAILNSAALSSAPFLIPKTSSTVKQFWTNKDSAGDMPTFPDIVFQCYVFKIAYSEILQLLERINPVLKVQLPGSFEQLAREHEAVTEIEKIQAAFTKQNYSPEQLEQLLAEAKYPAKIQHLLKSWLMPLKGSKSLYLNHYGEVGTITTIPFYQALDGLNAGIFNNKVVLIGYSESMEAEKTLGFYTFFSQEDGQTTSPIEIAATAIANLIDNTWLKPLDSHYQFLLLLCWGILLSMVGRLFAFELAMSFMMVLSGCYAYLAYYKFSTDHVWLPLVIPLVLQMPLILVTMSISHFMRTKLEKNKMQFALRHLLPREVVDNIYRHSNKVPMSVSGEVLRGVCMATDVSDYTKIAESLRPSELIDLMNAYYAAIFPPVNSYGGYITDLAGDGMYAVWVKSKLKQDSQIRINACYAALKSKETIHDFNKSQQCRLLTRFGLDYGEISIGNTGAAGRYVYRALGDPVNTAARIEGLNKQLGTHILVSANVIDGLSEFFTRELGLFRMKGKANAVPVFELIAPIGQVEAHWPPLTLAFAEALNLFQTYQWTEALAAFRKIKDDYPDDGPTLFFIRYLQQTKSVLPEVRDEGQVAVIEIANFSV